MGYYGYNNPKIERTTERGEGEETEETPERDRRGEQRGMCAKNNDRPIQRPYIAKTHITCLNQFAPLIHMPSAKAALFL